ncbi:hypothetical protein CPC735_043700 [Coccidioides posadasii C735 delta SOWgp]|uniref:Nucleolar protein 12 n=2 Tax=Coccidioides posadasii TaxID=199306 RepID=A0A0J6ID68_COCPO|nr:hypothetical protein CPC735_043700 [Coccidioides posadasii C735 delta SOWgp]EER25926.1 hypothetical protein CPC735_043700 [Coccidioides posadasii C735 delta SOWgp]KMM69647.1 hypothetical protein CPAG_05961 [Coccidioides posadasii RMSCC 3488]|eukprot:XP_003068071.1 hypothetical protein CPC735_043700 [Coccidioides posadasii C735 delta SOWgp]
MAPPPKRRKLAIAPVDEIVFDNDARHDFLTGFHKRKVQRAKHAQEIAEKKAKEERREHRRKLREERQAEFQRALDQNRKRIQELNGPSESESESNPDQDNDAEWAGFPEPVDYEAEYIDENKYTTVTVEDMDPSKEGMYKAAESIDGVDEDEESPKTTGAVTKTPEKQTSTGNDRSQAKKKKKKRKFRYESHAERKITRMKERMGNRKQAKARRAT